MNMAKGPKDPGMELHSFCTGNRKHGVGYIPATWVLGPLGWVLPR